MPIPPKASTEVPCDRHFHFEVSQILRALQANGKLSSEELSRLIGADHWESGVLECALNHATRDGLVTCEADGTLAAN